MLYKQNLTLWSKQFWIENLFEKYKFYNKTLCITVSLVYTLINGENSFPSDFLRKGFELGWKWKWVNFKILWKPFVLCIWIQLKIDFIVFKSIKEVYIDFGWTTWRVC